MLSKLLKYEIKATARVLLPLYAALLVFAAVNKGISAMSQNRWEAPEVISMAVYIMVMIGIFVMTLVVTIQRFYKNLLSDEGYLMLTLPVESWKHIVSKLLIAMLWSVVSGIIALLSIFIIAFDKILTAQFLQDVSNVFNEFLQVFNVSIAFLIVGAVLAFIISLAANVLIIYASMALGHLFNRHRILASIGAFVALNTASQIVLTVAAFIPGILFFPGNISMHNGFTDMEPILHGIVWYTVIFLGLLSAGYFIVTNHILSKRLNLE